MSAALTARQENRFISESVLSNDISRIWHKVAAPIVLAGGLYFLLASSTIYFTSNGRNIASIWPANAVLLALLLRQGPAQWTEILIAGFFGNVLANLVMRGSFVAPLLFGAINLIEVSIAAVALRRFLKQSSPIGAPDTLGHFIVWAGLVAPAVSGIGGAATAATIFGEPFVRALSTWFFSDALGLLLFTPFWLSMFAGEYARCFRERSKLQRMEVAALQFIAAAFAFAVFFCSRQPLLFTLFPSVMLVSFRVGRLGTQTAVIIVAVIGAIATMRGLGPVSLFSADHAQQAAYFQLFLAIVLLSCLPMSAGLSARVARTDELANRERDLSAANTTLQSFSANAAHDLRSPLATFVSALTLVKRDRASSLSENAVTYIDMVITSATGLADTIGALLIASKARDMKSSLDFVDTDLDHLLNEVRFNLTALVERSGALISSDPLPRLSVEPSLFRQLLQNLIENSIKYRSSDRPLRIYIRHKESSGYHVFSVEDNGVGIGTIAARRVFERYEQENKTGINGVGLGLALCANIAGLHNGSIAIDPEFTEGCRITFDVPILDAAKRQST